MYDYALVAIGSGGSENTTDMVRETSLYSSKREREDINPQIKVVARSATTFIWGFMSKEELLTAFTLEVVLSKAYIGINK
jgi:hypothetical protein